MLSDTQVFPSIIFFTVDMSHFIQTLKAQSSRCCIHSMTPNYFYVSVFIICVIILN